MRVGEKGALTCASFSEKRYTELVSDVTLLQRGALRTSRKDPTPYKHRTSTDPQTDPAPYETLKHRKAPYGATYEHRKKLTSHGTSPRNTLYKHRTISGHDTAHGTAHGPVHAPYEHFMRRTERPPLRCLHVQQKEKAVESRIAKAITS
jgi:hypothetical protein